MARVNDDRSSQQQFLGSAATVSVTMGFVEATAAQNSEGQNGRFELSTATQQLLSKFGLTYPIFRAPAGGAASPDLVIAVCNAGAIGGMAAWPLPAEEVASRVARVRSATSKAFFVNCALAAREPKSLRAALDAGAPVVQFSWGMPDVTLVAAVRQAGAKMGIQVTSAGSARARLTSVRTIWSAKEPKRAATSVVMTPAASTGRAFASSRLLGGVSSSGKFAAHQVYKDALLRSTKADTVLTVCLNGRVGKHATSGAAQWDIQSLGRGRLPAGWKAAW
jgi:Nitronate monooxygenase